MGIPIYMHIQQYIKAQIASGAWPEGSLIPTESELSKQFSCSRITVTTALRELVKDGIIYRIQGKGTYVSEQSAPEKIYERNNLAQMKLSLDAMSIPGEHKCVYSRIECPDEEVVGILQLGSEQKTVSIGRIKYVEDKPFAAEILYLPQLLYPTVLERHLEDQHINQLSEAYGITVGKSYISSEPVLCDAEVGEMLNIPVGEPILKFCIEIYDTRERPVACDMIFLKGRQSKTLLS